MEDNLWRNLLYFFLSAGGAKFEMAALLNPILVGRIACPLQSLSTMESFTTLSFLILLLSGEYPLLLLSQEERQL